MQKFLMLFIFIFSLLIESCGQSSFPDNINNIKSDDLKRINGTKVFILPNDLYKEVFKTSILQKNNSTFIKVVDFLGSAFKESNYATSENDPEIKTYKKVKFNGFNGIYIEGVAEGKILIEICFGDSTFETIITAECSQKDNTSRKEMLDLLSHSFYDKTLKLDALELANFTVDTNSTGFHFTKFDPRNGFEYWPDNNNNDFYFTIEPLFFSSFEEEEKEFLRRKSNSNWDVITHKKLLLNNNQAYISNLKKGGREIYEVRLMSGHSGILFSGFDLNQQFLPKYQEIIKSIHLISK